MNARRCSMCAINWPCTNEYLHCPECGAGTDTLGSATPLPADEALSRKRHAEFARFYETREEKRKRLPGFVPPEFDAALDGVSASSNIDWDAEAASLGGSA